MKREKLSKVILRTDVTVARQLVRVVGRSEPDGTAFPDRPIWLGRILFYFFGGAGGRGTLGILVGPSLGGELGAEPLLLDDEPHPEAAKIINTADKRRPMHERMKSSQQDTGEKKPPPGSDGGVPFCGQRAINTPTRRD